MHKQELKSEAINQFDRLLANLEKVDLEESQEYSNDFIDFINYFSSDIHLIFNAILEGNKFPEVQKRSGSVKIELSLERQIAQNILSLKSSLRKLLTIQEADYDDAIFVNEQEKITFQKKIQAMVGKISLINIQQAKLFLNSDLAFLSNLSPELLTNQLNINTQINSTIKEASQMRLLDQALKLSNEIYIQLSSYLKTLGYFVKIDHNSINVSQGEIQKIERCLLFCENAIDRLIQTSSSKDCNSQLIGMNDFLSKNSNKVTTEKSLQIVLEKIEQMDPKFIQLINLINKNNISLPEIVLKKLKEAVNSIQDKIETIAYAKWDGKTYTGTQTVNFIETHELFSTEDLDASMCDGFTGKDYDPIAISEAAIEAEREASLKR